MIQINYYIKMKTNIGSPGNIPLKDCPIWVPAEQKIINGEINETILSEAACGFGYSLEKAVMLLNNFKNTANGL